MLLKRAVSARPHWNLPCTLRLVPPLALTRIYPCARALAGSIRARPRIAQAPQLELGLMRGEQVECDGGGLGRITDMIPASELAATATVHPLAVPLSSDHFLWTLPFSMLLMGCTS